MATQGPPFDGKPCPVCPVEARGLSAVVHNFLCRFRASPIDCKTARKYRDLQHAVSATGETIAQLDPVIQRLYVAARRFVEVADAGPPTDWARLRELAAVMETAEAAVSTLCEAHFANSKHCTGGVRL